MQNSSKLNETALDKYEEALIFLGSNQKHTQLLCPFCKKQNIIITNLENDLIYFKCKCKIYRMSCTIKEMLNTIQTIEMQTDKCFRHKENISSSYCLQCKLYMCETCDSYHSSFQPDHETTKTDRMENNMCIEHSNQRKEFYCQQCQTDLCELCKTATKIHSSHLNEIIPIKNFYEKIKEALKYKTTENLVEKYTLQLQNIKDYKDKQINKLNGMINLILSAIDTINNTYSQTINENYDKMALNKVIFDIFFNIQKETFPVYSYSLIHNALQLHSFNLYENNNDKISAKTKGNNNRWGATTTNNNYGFGFSNTNNQSFDEQQNQNKADLEEILNNITKNAKKFFHKNTLNFSKVPTFSTQKKHLYFNAFTKKRIIIKNNSILPKCTSFPSEFETITCVIELSDKNLALVANSPKIQIFDPIKRKVLKKLEGHKNLPTSLCELANGHLLSSSLNIQFENTNGFGQKKSKYKCATNYERDGIREWSLQTGICIRVITNFGFSNILLHLKDNTVVLDNIDILIVDFNTLNTKCIFNSNLNSYDIKIHNNKYIYQSGTINEQGGFGMNTRPIKGGIKMWDLDTKDMILDLIYNGYVPKIEAVPTQNKLIIVEKEHLVLYDFITKQTETRIPLINILNRGHFGIANFGGFGDQQNTGGFGGFGGFGDQQNTGGFGGFGGFGGQQNTFDFGNMLINDIYDKWMIDNQRIALLCPNDTIIVVNYTTSQIESSIILNSQINCMKKIADNRIIAIGCPHSYLIE